MAKRIYKITTPKGSRLVDASIKAQALAHVVKDEITVEIATGHDIAALVSSGVKVERIGEPDTVDLFEPELPPSLPALPDIDWTRKNPFAERDGVNA